VPLLQDNERKVLYLGGCEERGPGDQIEANTRRYIGEHSDRVFSAETWIKVALTPAQVARSPRLRALAIDRVDNRCKPLRPVPGGRVRSGRGRRCWSACCGGSSTPTAA